jgi:hypothetical protein
MTSTIKVDNIQDQDGNNIINENANTITIGASGDTVTLASGASQSGFGRTGTVDWQTGSIKTANFTAVSGEGYFANTTSSAFTMTLPSGSAGAIVSVQDYANTFDTNTLTVSPASGEKINGGAGNVGLSTQGQGLTLVYIDSTQGWRSVQDNVFDAAGSNYVAATGGTITTCGDWKIHTFTSPGTFTVTAAGSPAGSNTADYLVIAGGGGGGGGAPGNPSGGGGGAGGFRESSPAPGTDWTDSPKGNPGGALPVSIQAYPITVGAGGALGNRLSGSNSVFSTITSAGGGGGGKPSFLCGGAGGSGGGAGANGGTLCISGGSGNTPPVSPPQGTDGGTNGGGGPGAQGDNTGGGGGATENGQNANPSETNSGRGGAGATTCITGSPVAYAGGGGGGGRSDNPVCSGAGSPCGTGGKGGGHPSPQPVNGDTNTGGGGGGTESNGSDGGSGGSGIVVIRYKFQN